jgi:hypothetical protein
MEPNLVGLNPVGEPNPNWLDADLTGFMPFVQGRARPSRRSWITTGYPAAALAALTDGVMAAIVRAIQPDYPGGSIVFQIVMFGAALLAAVPSKRMSQALNRLRATVSLPRYSPPMPRPPSGDRGWMAGSSGVGASVASGAADSGRCFRVCRKRPEARSVNAGRQGGTYRTTPEPADVSRFDLWVRR